MASSLPKDGLVTISQATTRGVRRVVPLLVTSLFIATLFVTGVIDSIFPVPLPRLVGQEAKAEAQLRRNARLQDGSLARLVEHDQRLRSRARRAVVPDYAFELYRWFQLGRRDLLVGKDGWLFYSYRVYTPDLPDGILAGVPAARLSALDRRLAQAGIRFVVAPVPRKSVMCREHLPKGVDPRPRLALLYLRELERRGVRTVDLMTPLSSSQVKPVYYKAGPHWNQQGQLLAAEAICGRAGILKPPEQRQTYVRSVGLDRQELDQLRYLGVEIDRRTEQRSRLAARVKEYLSLDATPSYGVFNADNEQIVHRRRPDLERVAIMGTSFSAGGKLVEFMEHFAQEPILGSSERGGEPIDQLLKLLQNYPILRPEIFIMEIPNCIIFRYNPLPRIGELMAELTPQTCTVLANGPRQWVAPVFRQEAPVTRRSQRIISIPAGVVYHTASGAVGLRLRGRVSGGTLRVDVNAGSGSLSVPWYPRKREIVIPIIGCRPTGSVSATARVASPLSTSVTLHVTAVDLVSDAERVRIDSCIVGPVTTTRSGWSQQLRFGKPIPVNRYSVLELLFDAEDGFGTGFTIEVSSSDATVHPVTLTVSRLRRGGVVCVELGEWSAVDATAVTCRGSGTAPRRGIRQAALHHIRGTFDGRPWPS